MTTVLSSKYFALAVTGNCKSNKYTFGPQEVNFFRTVVANGYGYDFEFNLPIKDIDDGKMIQIMANENMQEWSHSVGVADETVKVTKEYLDLHAGKQMSEKYNNKNVISSYDIADFLGWKAWKVQDSLKRLNLISEGIIENMPVTGNRHKSKLNKEYQNQVNSPEIADFLGWNLKNAM